MPNWRLAANKQMSKGTKAVEDELEEQGEAEIGELPSRVETLIQRLYRDPRYLLVGKVERFGRERIAFVEGCTILSATGEARGQALLDGEYEMRGRPDGERPHGEESLLDYYLSARSGGRLLLGEEELAELREESWQYYVRRNFAFLLKEFARASAKHELVWDRRQIHDPRRSWEKRPSRKREE